jgi:SAM-dependent methyltransferase
MPADELFSNKNFWTSYGTTPDYAERIDIIRSLIPPDTSSLIDIGCGKGDVINALLESRPDLRIVGVDPFSEASEYIKAAFVRATLPHLPFENQSFDLVQCLEVLEHVSQNDFTASLGEIQRLAKKYIIIGVPYKENLETLQALCSNCRHKSHAYGHLRSFRAEDMENLLNEFVMEKSVLAGIRQRRKSGAGVWVEHNLARIYHSPKDYTCSNCGSHSLSVPLLPKIIAGFVSRLSDMLTKMSPSEPYWILAVYKRKNGR